MINERIPALAADLDAFDTSVLSEIYARRGTTRAPLFIYLFIFILAVCASRFALTRSCRVRVVSCRVYRACCAVSEELDPIRIIQFLNLVNLESRMHSAGINCRHMGRLRQLVHNKAMRSYILCAVHPFLYIILYYIILILI
jgi:hypothetical protein